MKFLFLSILMLGVGVGVVGCEDDGNEPPQADEVAEGTSGGGRKYDLDFYGRVSIPAIPGGSVAGHESGFIIVGEDGAYYDPQDSLPEAFRAAGMRVWVLAKTAWETNSVGLEIDIVEIRQR